MKIYNFPLLISILIFIYLIIGSNGQNCPEIDRDYIYTCQGVNIKIINGLEFKSNFTVTPTNGSTVYIENGVMMIQLNQNGLYNITGYIGSTCIKSFAVNTSIPMLSYVQPTCPFQKTNVIMKNYYDGATATLNGASIPPGDPVSLMPGFYQFQITQNGITCNLPLNLYPSNPTMLPQLTQNTKTCLSTISTLDVINKGDYSEIKVFDDSNVEKTLQGLDIPLNKVYTLHLTSKSGQCKQEIPVQSYLQDVVPVVTTPLITKCNSSQELVTITLPGYSVGDIPLNFIYTYNHLPTIGATFLVDRGVINTVLVTPSLTNINTSMITNCPNGFNVTFEVPSIPFDLSYTFKPAPPSCTNDNSTLEFNNNVTGMIMINGSPWLSSSFHFLYGNEYIITSICNDEKLVFPGFPVPQFKYISTSQDVKLTCLSNVTLTFVNYLSFTNITVKNVDDPSQQAIGVNGVYQITPSKWSISAGLLDCPSKVQTKEFDFSTIFNEPVNTSMATFEVIGLPQTCTESVQLQVTPIINGIRSIVSTNVTYVAGESYSIDFKYGGCQSFVVNYTAPLLPMFQTDLTVNVINPVVCSDQANGTIKLVSTSTINNNIQVYYGMNYNTQAQQVPNSNNTMFNVPNGQYPIKLQLSSNPRCYYVKNIKVDTILEPLNSIKYDVTPQSLSNCDTPTGVISVVNYTQFTYIQLNNSNQHLEGKFMGLTTGTYLLRYAKGGCQDTEVYITVPIEHLPIVVTTTRLPTCMVNNNGINVGDGIAKLNYTLSNGTNVDGIQITTSSGSIYGDMLVDIPSDTLINLEFKKGSQCLWKHTFTLSQNNEPILSAITSKSATYGLHNGEVSIALNNPSYTLNNIELVPNTLPYIVSLDLHSIKGFDETVQSIPIQYTYNQVCKKLMTIPVTSQSYPLPSFTLTPPVCNVVYSTILFDAKTMTTYDLYLDDKQSKLSQNQSYCEPGQHQLLYKYKWQSNAPIMSMPILCPGYSGNPAWDPITTSLNYTLSSESCVNSMDGKLTVTNPDPNVDYVLFKNDGNSSQIMPSFVSLGQGVYKLRAYKKGTTCYSVVDNIVIGNNEPQVQIYPMGICSIDDSSKGSLGISFGTSTQFTNTSVFIDGLLVTPDTNGRFTNLISGEHNVTIHINDKFCPRSYPAMPFEIIDNEMTVTAQETGQCGEIMVNVQGGNSPNGEYTINIMGDMNGYVGKVVIKSSPHTLTTLTNSNYTITVSDEQGCQVQAQPIISFTKECKSQHSQSSRLPLSLSYTFITILVSFLFYYNFNY